MRAHERAALHGSLHQGTCPSCGKTFSLMFADLKKRDILVLPEHNIMPKTADEARVRDLPVCPGSKQQR